MDRFTDRRTDRMQESPYYDGLYYDDRDYMDSRDRSREYHDLRERINGYPDDEIFREINYQFRRKCSVNRGKYIIIWIIILDDIMCKGSEAWKCQVNC